MERGDGHAREGGEQRQQQRPPRTGPVLRLPRASQKQPPQPARHNKRPVQQPRAQAREVGELITVGRNERRGVFFFFP